MRDIASPPLKTLLVIDDEQDICELVTDVGEMLGFCCDQCIEINNLAELSLMDVPDILALDLSMPNVDGIEIINHLGTQPKKPQLILMSGFERSVLDGAHKLADRLDIPVLGQLNKPFSLQHLKELLETPLPNADCSTGNQPPSPQSRKKNSFTPEDIQLGIIRDEFRAHYQPQVDLASGQLHGVEALVRWHHPNGLIMPDDFLPMIESNQLILPLTCSVIEQTLSQMALWDKAGLPFLQTSINLSAAYLGELDLPGLMTELMKKYPLTPGAITFEITERISLNESNQDVLDTLTRLRLKGFYLSIDDFGTGYSSLSQLNQLPFNEVKIDKSFVMHLTTSPISKAIVESSITLARQLGVRCVAEGIESPEVEALLKEMGCDIGQGYFYSKALPPEHFTSWAKGFIDNRLAAT